MRGATNTLAVLALCGAGVAVRDQPGSAPPAPIAVRARVASVVPAVRPAAPPVPAIAVRPIAGWIIDGEGSPIAGVRIDVRDPAGVASIAIAESEPDGAFRLEPIARGSTVLLDAPHTFPAELAWRDDGPAPRIMLSRRMQLAARVTAGGSPVAGAEVTVSDGSGPVVATAVTDADGVAEVDDLLPGPYELWARRGTMVSPLVRTAPGGGEAPTEVALGLEPAARVHGLVSAEGAATPGAVVMLVPIDVDHAARLATVDAAGRFAIEGVPAGQWRLEADAPGFVRDVDPIVDVADARGAVEVDVRLVRAGVVTGAVVDATGTPVANATIVLREQGAISRAALADRLAIEPSATTRPLRWVHPLAGERQMPIRESRVFGAPRAGTRPAECGQGHCGVDLGTQRGVVVHAAADGHLAAVFTEIRHEAGRYVAIEHSGGLRTSYMHLDEVRADLEIGQAIRAGDPVGTVGTTGFAKPNPHLHFSIAQARAGRTLYVDPEPILRHAVVLPVARTLTAEPGAVAAAPTVIAQLRWREIDPERPAAPAAVSRPFTTDALGAFRLDGIAPGTYVAAAFDAALAPGVSATFRVYAGVETGGVAITLVPGVVVRGRVLGAAGPIHGARIVADEGFGETTHQVATAYTDRSGEFVLRALSGTLALTVDAAGHGAATRTLALDGDRSDRREDFELVVEDARLEGTVVGPDGGPVAGARVTTVDGPTRRRHAITDGRGWFAIDRLGAGRYVVELASADHPTTRATAVAAAGGGGHAELRLEQGGSVRIDLRDVHTAAPLAGIRIDATGPDGRTERPTTDAAGVAILHGLAPGAWTLRVRATGYVAGERVVRVRAATTSDDIRIELGRGATLAGIVRDRYGQRVAGARVWLGSASTRTDRDGRFRLVDAPTGAVELRADTGTANGSVALELAPGDELVTLGIDLAE